MRYLDKIVDQIETVWICGGSSVYHEAISSARCHCVYYTNIHADLECDKFFPKISRKDFRQVNDSKVPKGVQQENAMLYEFQVWEKRPLRRPITDELITAIN